MTKSFDRTSIRLINSDIEDALKAVGEKHGVHISLGSSTYTPDNYTTKMSVSVKRDGKVVTPEALAFEKFAPFFNIVKNLGDTFTHGGKKYTITGLKPKSTKYPVLAKDAQGRTFKFMPETVNKG